jgi:hypothetical protein
MLGGHAGLRAGTGEHRVVHTRQRAGTLAVARARVTCPTQHAVDGRRHVARAGGAERNARRHGWARVPGRTAQQTRAVGAAEARLPTVAGGLAAAGAGPSGSSAAGPSAAARGAGAPKSRAARAAHASASTRTTGPSAAARAAWRDTAGKGIGDASTSVSKPGAEPSFATRTGGSACPDPIREHARSRCAPGSHGLAVRARTHLEVVGTRARTATSAQFTSASGSARATFAIRRRARRGLSRTRSQRGQSKTGPQESQHPPFHHPTSIPQTRGIVRSPRRSPHSP